MGMLADPMRVPIAALRALGAVGRPGAVRWRFLGASREQVAPALRAQPELQTQHGVALTHCDKPTLLQPPERLLRLCERRVRAVGDRCRVDPPTLGFFDLCQNDAFADAQLEIDRRAAVETRDPAPDRRPGLPVESTGLKFSSWLAVFLLGFGTWSWKGPPLKDRLHIYRRACVGSVGRGPRYEPLGRTPFTPRA